MNRRTAGAGEVALGVAERVAAGRPYHTLRDSRTSSSSRGSTGSLVVASLAAASW